ncbi:hypothetical protein ACA910_011517 [Epithemia clementina (nom. ined.)]
MSTFWFLVLVLFSHSRAIPINAVEAFLNINYAPITNLDVMKKKETRLRIRDPLVGSISKRQRQQRAGDILCREFYSPSLTTLRSSSDSELADDTSSSLSNIESPSPSSPLDAAVATPSSSSAASLGLRQTPPPLQDVVFVTNMNGGGTWRDRLLKVSNFASVLCVLDCTILPIITMVLPFFGVMAGSPAQMEFLHKVGHKMALYFVLPVGGLATTLNYTNHKKLWIAALGYLGLLGVLLASFGCQLSHGMVVSGTFAGQAVQKLLHKILHHATFHRVANISGCAMLLFSNFMARRQNKGCCEKTAYKSKHKK